ncbi:E-selectin-like isoform X2 [Halichondria panicea]|uniref:E-selectin-like isoform X2 n=1 Tax=Halichondria panicea TaxID=6063 RepID=UPI00312B5506
MMAFSIVTLILAVTICISIGHAQPVFLTLRSTTITINNTNILITAIGEDANGGLPPLTCHTDLTACCRSRADNNGNGGLGHWAYPNGSVILNKYASANAGQQFYIVRNASQLIRLARREFESINFLNLTGSYCCTVPTMRGDMTLCANLVVCPSLTLTNGIISYSNSTLTVATHTCKKWFPLVGDNTRTCSNSGSWSGSAPHCRVFCRDLDKHMADITIMYNDGTRDDRPPGTEAIYDCHTGNTLNGEAVRRCQDDGTWSGIAPTCQPVDCGQIFAPSHGQISLTRGTLFNSQAEYTCDNCFRMNGVSVRICGADGDWVPDPPTCRVLSDCGRLTAPMNGTVESSPNTECGSVATYSCASGFVLEGVVSRLCQQDGQWSDEMPSCDPVDCGPLINPQNGTVNTSLGTTYTREAIYSCNSGYCLNGPERRTCNADRQWRPEAPTCNPVDCGPLLNLTNGRVDTSSGTKFMDRANYTCYVGYDLVGVSSRECQEDGHWSHSEPVCKIVDCGPLEPPENGQPKNTELRTTYTSVAVFCCDEGYVLNGAASRTCTASGDWSASAPSCDPMDCGVLEAPANGHVNTSQGTHFMDTVVYSCATGYNLTGCPSAVCQSNGTWSCDPPFCADNTMIQLKFGPTRYCVEWTDETVNLMYKIMHIAITKAVQSQKSGNDIPMRNIQPGYFTCYKSPTRTTYRTTITGTKSLSAVEYAELISEWVESGVTTRVLWYAIKMEKACPVVIASMYEEECE